MKALDIFVGNWRMAPVLLALFALWGLLATMNPVFLTSHNLTNLSMQIVVTAMVSLGLILALIVGEIDLSIGYLSAVCAAIAARISTELDLPLPIALLSAVAAGAVWGACQAVIVTAFAVPSFIISLGGMLILTAILLLVMPASGQILLVNNPIADIANSFLPTADSVAAALLLAAAVGWLLDRRFREGRRAGRRASYPLSVLAPVAAVATFSLALVAVFEAHRGVPTAVAVLLATLVAFSYVMGQTKFGTYVYAIGENAEAARRAGIRVRRVKISVFALMGGLSGLAGVIAASRVMSVSSQALDPSLLLEAIAAAVIGGVSLFGGRGSVWAALVGALVMGTITNGMLLLNVSTPVRLEIQGAILVAAVIGNHLIERHAKKPSRREG